jgi:CheY-like chemotaxis protein/glycine cleavage system H lipoate-binding protein
MRDILVIDDEPPILRAVARICEAEGYTISCAEDARTALRNLEQNSYRLALCDIMMSGLDGFEFLAELTRRGLDTPVVMMTGYSTVDIAVKSLTTPGTVDFMAKPFTSDELLTVIRRSLRCTELVAESEAASLNRSEVMVFVPCPANYVQLGYVSWAVMEDEGTARIGVTDLFLKSADGIVDLSLSEPGEELVQGITCAEATSPDGAVHHIMCPLTGEIIERNEEALKNLSLVEKDPYFKGWLYRILPTNPENNLRWLSP